MKLQCLYYALDKWNEDGGYIVFRKSTHWCMPHVLHLNNKTNELTHYVPPADLTYPWYSMFGFEGFIKHGDTEECVPVDTLCMFFGTLALVIFGTIWFIHRTLITRSNKRRRQRRKDRSNKYVFRRSTTKL